MSGPLLTAGGPLRRSQREFNKGEPQDSSFDINLHVGIMLPSPPGKPFAAARSILIFKRLERPSSGVILCQML